MSPLDKLTPTDPRITHHTILLNNQPYHYLLATPPAPVATILLLHGWPDLSFGFRAQIPLLLSLNLRVVAPDLLGFGRSASPPDLSFYTTKRAADDLAALAAHLNAPRLLVLAHDWGGAVAYRLALWHPRLVRALCVVCTPYTRAALTYTPLAPLVQAGVLPNFAYQLALASGEVEERIRTPEDIRGFLNAVYGARTPDGRPGFDVRSGPDFAVIKSGELQRTPLLSEEELDYYIAEYVRGGMRGPSNWYRTRELNFEEELPLAKGGVGMIRAPTMFVAATRDEALPLGMSRGMEQNFVEMRRREVDGGHWILVQKAEECNRIIGEFFTEMLGRGDEEGGEEEGKGGKSKI